MADQNFLNLLGTPGDTVTAPQRLPEGRWRLRVETPIVKEPNAARDQPGVINFPLVPLEPIDVDEDALEGFELTETRVYHRIYMRTKEDQYRLLRLLRTMGLVIDQRSVLEIALSSEGCVLVATVQHETNPEDPDLPFVRLSHFGAP